MTALTMKRAAAIAAGVLTLAACGNSGDSGIAHLGSGDQPSATADGSSTTAEEQALAYAQCMRDNGVDFPDPTVEADGTLSFAGALRQAQGGGFDPTDTSFRDAQDACQGLMEGLVLGGGRAGGGFDSTEMQDAMLEYTACLRSEGLDVGDITFDGPGLRGGGADAGTSDVQPTIEPGAAPPAGVDRGDGDPTDRFASILGQDPTDPAWISANEACSSVLQDAMSNFGPGAASTSGQG